MKKEYTMTKNINCQYIHSVIKNLQDTGVTDNSRIHENQWTRKGNETKTIAKAHAELKTRQHLSHWYL